MKYFKRAIDKNCTIFNESDPYNPNDLLDTVLLRHERDKALAKIAKEIYRKEKALRLLKEQQSVVT